VADTAALLGAGLGVAALVYLAVDSGGGSGGGSTSSDRLQSLRESYQELQNSTQLTDMVRELEAETDEYVGGPQTGGGTQLTEEESAIFR